MVDNIFPAIECNLAVTLNVPAFWATASVNVPFSVDLMRSTLASPSTVSLIRTSLPAVSA